MEKSAHPPISIAASVEGGSRVLSRADVVAIIAIGLVTFGLYLVTDTRVADDWMYLTWLEDGDWTTFKYFHEHYNNFLQAVVLWPARFFPDVDFALRVLSVTCIIANGIAVYSICMIARLWRRDEARAVALLTVAYPAFMWHASVIYSDFYNLPVFAFYVGLYLLLWSETRRGLAAIVLARCASAVLFLWSFYVGSLLVFFYACLVLHLYVVAAAKTLRWRDALSYYARRRSFLLLLPLCFRYGYEFFAHPYVNNPIDMAAPSLFEGYRAFGLALFLQAKQVATTSWFLWGAATALPVLIAVALARSRRSPFPSDAASPSRIAMQLLLGAWLLVCGVFPYAAVAKYPELGVTTGYSTRTLLLAQWPMAILIVGAIEMVARRRYLAIPAWAAFAGILAGSISIQIADNLKWQYDGILSRAFDLDLSELPAASNLTHITVVDKTYFLATVHLPLASLPSVFSQIFPTDTYIFGDLATEQDALSVARKTIPALAADYDTPGTNLVDAWRVRLPTEARSGIVIVCPGPGFRWRSNALTLPYQRDRWLHPENMAGFLRPLLDLRLVPVLPEPNPSSVDYACSRDPFSM